MLTDVEAFIALVRRILDANEISYSDLAEILRREDEKFRLRYVKELLILLRLHGTTMRDFVRRYRDALLIAERRLPPRGTKSSQGGQPIRLIR